MVWVEWNGTKVAHAAKIQAADVRVGSFPLLCGRWAPDGWDKDVTVSHCARRCRRCEKASSE